MSVIAGSPNVLIVRTDASQRSALESTGGRASRLLENVSHETASPQAWHAVAVADELATMHPWDSAHRALDAPERAGLESAGPLRYVEPDLVQSFPCRPIEPDMREGSFGRAEACQQEPIDQAWPSPQNRFGWHLDDDYSQLRAARQRMDDPGDGNRIRVGILDTGYDPAHVTLPLHMRYSLSKNFSGDGPESNATDPGSNFPTNNPGHGTATLALLAGKEIDFLVRDGRDFIGGAPHAEIVPIRIANSVVHFKTSSMANGIKYAAEKGCRVASISMGGVPNRLWADAVNFAYENGMCIFAAAGNRFGQLPPETLVYPARFGRVVGVCGYTADKTPYRKDGFHRMMHGCFGPRSTMKSAMAAFTPNIPWAAMGCGSLVRPNGTGTSSATPQCAAAAALWLQKHRPDHAEKWRVVEGVRHALFSKADTSVAGGEVHFGNGLLRAGDALTVPFKDDLPMTPRDEVSFPWLRLTGFLEAETESTSIKDVHQRMFETETLQLYMQTPSLLEIAGDADPHTDQLDSDTRKRFLNKLRALPTASQTLRSHLDKWISAL